jgi:hypothetical protein
MFTVSSTSEGNGITLHLTETYAKTAIASNTEPMLKLNPGVTLMLGFDKSRGYCLEMICADFLAGAHLDNANPEILLSSISHHYSFLPPSQKRGNSRLASRGLT